MFIDSAKIRLKAGRGGDGAVAWRREKYEPAGGPHGGDGGRGGDVIIKADEGLHTLMDFRYKREYKAQNGENGMNKLKYGKAGEDIILKVPVGTLVKDEETGGVIYDFKNKDDEFVICHGGRGGHGNAKYKTSTRRSPNFAQAGTKGEERSVILELKLLADVGLVGFPNVGKSTLLSQVSKARPKISNYHFTTLTPNLGLVSLGPEESFVLADIPGLIEGASQGIGLGDEFLKHIERTGVLIHVLDVSGSENRDPLEDFYKINEELYNYNEKLRDKTQIIFANKMDIPSSKENLEKLKKALASKYQIIEGSAATGENVKLLMQKAYQLVQEKGIDYKTYDKAYVENKVREEAITVRKENDDYIVEGPYIDKLMRSTNFNDYESLKYFQENLRKNNVIEKLKSLGIEEGQSVNIGGYEFEFFN
ncbi:GTPase ObgE [Peptoniphilus lacrimalis]|uniref:GTPase ObgE n=1 Tax=Peptoniphilus lacrimalis TaxID=33031 RepID=UPI000510289F|nr:GTPase ObgE [Peptoniphilus lacrimalis]KGF29762.1 GTPase [Peptoniphilus lacrimalis DNF00528]MDK7721632.1 GTPase ObgE [Peptoniphilus lacrimalis]MDK7731234.1 GTPase ObgE [Peptoniphilus lacrimalis]